MKVTGPASGAPGADGAGLDKANPLGKVDKTGAAPAGRTFAETLAAGGPTSAPQAPTSAHAADPLTADIAADLKAGKVDAKVALDRVVERVLDQQLGPDAPATLRAQLRDALRDTISGDPFLAERLQGLG
jgi:hypothetical protein